MTWTVVAALLPAVAVGVFYFGAPALLVLVTAVAGCTAVETLHRRLSGRAGPVPGAAALTGLLLGMSLPPSAPLWLAVAGGAAAVVLPKLVLRALGFNPFHPVLLARVFLLLSFPLPMTAWSPPVGFFLSPPDVVTAATPLVAARAGPPAGEAALAARGASLLDGLVGRRPGSIGETSAAALALGGVFLLWRRVITWHVPGAFLGSVAALAAGSSAIAPGRFPGAAFHLVTGGLALAALFVASDRATSPSTRRGMLLHGAGCGLLTWVLRSFGHYPEGVAFAILLMSALTPLIEASARSREPLAD